MVSKTSCYRGSLQMGTKVVATIDVIIAILSLSFATFIIIMGIFPHLSDETSIKSILHDEQTAIKVGVNLLVSTFIVLVLAFVLIEGANKLDPVRCIVWIVVKVIFLVMITTSTILNTIYSPKWEQSIAAGGIVLTTLCICIVYRFIQQLKNHEDETKPTHNYTVNKI